MHNLLISTVKRTTRHPIETISVILVVAAVAYLSLLSSPVNSINSGNSSNFVWKPIQEVLTPTKAEEVEFTVKQVRLNKFDGNVDLIDKVVKDLMDIHVVDGLGTSHTFQDLCHKVNDKCLSKVEDDNLSFVFNVATPERLSLANLWTVQAMKLHTDISVNDQVYHVEGETRAPTSARAFRDAWQRSSNADVFIVAVGYILMHATFVSLFQNLRKIGSKFSLGFAVMLSSTVAMLVSLVVARLLGVKISIIQLSEAIPFFVVAIGFSKPYRLTKAIVNAKPGPETPIREKVVEGVKQVGPALLRDYGMEIAAIGLGALSGVPAMADFCFLACLILFFDCIFLFTLYLSVLSLKLELLRMRESSPQEGEKSALLQGKSVDGGMTLFSKFIRGDSKSSLADNVWMDRLKLWMILGFVAVHAMSASAGLGLITTTETNPQQVLELVKTVSSSHPVYFRVEPMLDLHATLATPSVLDSARIYWKDASPRDIVLVNSLILAISVLLGVHASTTRAQEHRRRSSIRSPPSTPRRVTSPFKEVKEVEVRQSPVKELIVKEVAKEFVKESPKKIVTVQEPTEELSPSPTSSTSSLPDEECRPLEECHEILKTSGPKALTDAEMVALVESGKVAGYALEKTLGDLVRAVKIRRMVVAKSVDKDDFAVTSLERGLPYQHYDYAKVMGVCCENVVGYLPLPVGIAGPLKVDAQVYQIPMATTEGCLVASTSRGCKAISACGGARTILVNDGMSRGPVVEFSNAVEAGTCRQWVESDEGFAIIKQEFDSTSRFARLKKIKCANAGRLLYMRFVTVTGDAMGMNMISKGCEKALDRISAEFPNMRVIAISGNYCTDKKPAAINWIEGRGKSVIAEAVISGEVVKTVLKTTVQDIVHLNTSKNLVGSAMAGSIGGFNAHAANILTAIYLATGQDPAQNVESSQCITLMESCNDGKDLYISCSMPCIEVGTVGGGTALPAQSACLDLLGVKGPHPTAPGANSQQLARIIVAAVMAGELSLCSALAAGHLVKSHMVLNRSSGASHPTPPAPPVVGSCIKS